MRRGKSSRTAQFVAFTRALGNLAPEVDGFSDPTARHLLPPQWVKKVERARVRLPRSPLPFWCRGMALFNQFRTVVLDRALLAALPFEQMVILGAGLDGRAWRLPELARTVVYEVDHPDTQSLKKDRVAALPVAAREVRFVAVDFTRDDLTTRLRAAGYESTRPTFWLWEGVTMYLGFSEIGELLSTIGRLSAAGSTVAATYFARRGGRIPRSWFLSLLGEPVRSAFAPDEFASLAAPATWTTVSNTGIGEWQSELAPHVALTERRVGLQWNERIWVGRK